MDGRYVDMLARRREEIERRVEAACAKSCRSVEDVSLVAVSKTVDLPAVLAAIEVGYRMFGENRPQELMRKLEGLRACEGLPSVQFDMIGNLQTNKVNAVLGRARLIHSIGSLHLAQAVSTRSERKMRAGELAGPQSVLIEVNISGEPTKSGFSADQLRRDLDEVRSLCGIRIEGLMTMAPRGDKRIARACFEGLRELRDELSGTCGLPLRELSCGMSEDFDLAIEEGSTLVRLGRVVFDPEFAVL